MTISKSAKLSTVKAWSATLTLGGAVYPLLALPSRSLGTTQSRGTCSCRINTFPNVASGTVATVDVTLNGETERYFTGKVDVRPVSDNPPTYEVSLIDYQNAFEETTLEEKLVWSNQSWTSVVRSLLGLAGITSGQITSVYDPGSTFKVAPIYPVTNEVGETVKTLLDELMEFAGTQLQVLANGSFQVVDMPGWPEDTPTTVYAYAASKAAGEFGFINSKRTFGGIEQIVARFKASGPKRPDLQIPDATFTLSGVTGKTESQEYRLIQTDACAEAIAEREIVKRNRQSTEVEVSAPLNPALRPYDSVMFRNPILGFTSNTPAIILATSGGEGDMSIQLSVGARPAAGNVSHVPPPVASFTYMCETQPLSLVGIIAPRFIVEAVCTATDPSGFGLESVEWTAACTGDEKPDPETVTWNKPKEGDVPDPKNTDDPLRPVIVFPTLTGATLTMTVESSSGEGATLGPVPIVPPESTLFTRTLSMACADGWWVLAGVSGWRKWGESCSAVPGMNDQGPLIAGFESGKIYGTDDYLASEPTLLGDLGSTIRCFFVNEGTPTHILAAAGKALSRSVNSGLAWTAVHTFDEDINYCESSTANVNEIRVCAGRSLWISYDGSAFTTLLTGPVDSTCRKVASAPWGHLAVWSGTTSNADSYKYEEEGYTLDWSSVAVEHIPVDLASVTPLQYEEGYVLAFGAVNDLVRDGLYGQLTYVAAQAGLAKFYKVDASRRVTYLSQTLEGGALKLVTHNKAFPIATAEDVFRIGYGQATNPARPPQLLVLPYAQTGLGDVLSRYNPDDGTWASIVLPLSGARWKGLDICPSRPLTEWLIWTDTKLFWTGTGGLTWIEVYFPAFGSYGGGIGGVCFTGILNAWIVSVYYLDAWGTSRFAQGYLAKGAGPFVTLQKLNGSVYPIGSIIPDGAFIHPTILIRGYSGEVWGYATISAKAYPEFGVADADRQVWINTSTLTTTVVGVTPYKPSSPGQAIYSRTGYSTWSNNIGWTIDYRDTLPTPLLAGGMNVGECESGLFVGGRVGIAEVRNLDTTPVLVEVAGSGVTVQEIYVGSSERSVATFGSDQTPLTIYAFNGVQWSSVAGPTNTVIVAALGIIEP